VTEERGTTIDALNAEYAVNVVFVERREPEIKKCEAW